jgi:hypothetical protein
MHRVCRKLPNGCIDSIQLARAQRFHVMRDEFRNAKTSSSPYKQ